MWPPISGGHKDPGRSPLQLPNQSTSAKPNQPNQTSQQPNQTSQPNHGLRHDQPQPVRAARHLGLGLGEPQQRGRGEAAVPAAARAAAERQVVPPRDHHGGHLIHQDAPEPARRTQLLIIEFFFCGRYVIQFFKSDNKKLYFHPCFIIVWLFR